MPRLETLSEVERQSQLNFPVIEHDDTPWTPLPKPLSECKVALVTTAGVHLRGDRPFVSTPEARDTSFRVIPSEAKAADIVLSHVSIGFDHTPFYKDVNITFPIDRLRELAEQGIIGGLTPNFYSFMGAQRNPKGIIDGPGPEAAQRLKAEGADVVLITPT